MDHHLCHRPYLRHDLVGHHVVDAAVIVVLRGRTPQSKVGLRLALQILACENPGGSHLCGIVVLQYLRHLLLVVALGGILRPECRGHRRHRLLVEVHAVVLRIGTCQRTDHK